jgi:hypothetical protein
MSYIGRTFLTSGDIMLFPRFVKLSGLFLCLSGGVYILDTALDAYLPQANPGLGAWVPVFGLLGFPGFALSLRRDAPSTLWLVAYALGMLGLAGLVAVTFLNNRLFPDIQPQLVGEIVRALRLEFLVIGLSFLTSALLLVPVCWNSGPLYRTGAVLYAIGAIPVSLPPLMPDGLIVAGGIAVGTGLLIWGGVLFQRPDEKRTTPRFTAAANPE